jgi:hypothetical protein
MTSTSDIPTYSMLGPDPEPLGLRADALLARLADAEPSCPGR